MNKKAFMEELRHLLKHLPKDDREDALNYYYEYFEEMGADEEQDVTIQVGQPKDAAREILASCTEKHLDNQKKMGGMKNSAMVIWMIILGICASPIAIPFVLVVIAMFFVVLLMLAAVVLTVACAGLSLFLAGFISLAAILWAGSFGQKMVCAGMGLIAIALGILLMIATVKLGELLVRGIAIVFKKVFIRRKVA